MSAPAVAIPRDRRRRTLLALAALAAVLVGVAVGGTVAAQTADTTDLASRNLPPSLEHPFGTDWLGRDMAARTLAGLRLSLVVGVVAAVISAVIALALAAGAVAFGRWFDAAVGWAVDTALSLPHIVLLLLVAVALGGGYEAVLVAVAVTHWPRLTRVLRGEARRVGSSDFVAAARRLGKGDGWVARRHLVPHLVPQFLVGALLLFPHAVLHEAGLSFLGVGISPDTPAIGVILAESMNYLSAGAWWLAVFPGLSLFALVKTVDAIGEQIKALVDPRSFHL